MNKKNRKTKSNIKSKRQLVIQGIRIDQSILRKKKIERCLLSECNAACCAGGVWLNPDEMPRILEWVEIIKKHLPSDRQDESKWFHKGKRDKNSPTGYEMGTTTAYDPLLPDNTCCVFLKSDRKCALQVISRENGLGWPGVKPFYCALYPLYLEDNILSVDEDTPHHLEGGTCSRPAAKATAIYKIYSEEATLVLGEDGYRELCQRAEQ